MKKTRTVIIKDTGLLHRIIETCILNGIASTDKISYLKMEDWLGFWRRLSTLITQSGEPQCIAFLAQLRRQLDE